MKGRPFWSTVFTAASVIFTAIQPATSHALNRPSRKDVSVLASRAGKGMRNMAHGAKKSITNAKDSASAALKRGYKSATSSVKSKLPPSSHVVNHQRRNKPQHDRSGAGAHVS